MHRNHRPKTFDREVELTWNYQTRDAYGKEVVRNGRFTIQIDDLKIMAALAQKAAKNKGARSQFAKGAVVVTYDGDSR